MRLGKHAARLLAFVGVAATLGLASCSGADGPSESYDVVIQVYNPTVGPTGTATVYCNAWLYDASGTELAQGEVITYANWPRIEATLDAGTYFLKVVGTLPAQSGAYAIAAVLQGDAEPLFGTALLSGEDPYEDDGAAVGNVPSDPAVLPWEGALNRYLEAGEVDWMRLVLP